MKQPEAHDKFLLETLECVESWGFSARKSSGKVRDKSMKKKISHGKKDLISAEDFDAKKNIKERITIWLDEEVLDGFRNRAIAEGTKYQTLLNQALRDALKRPSLVDRVERLEKKLGVG